MDDWHRRVSGQLVARTRARGQSDAESALEIAFGRVRAAMAFVLEFARAHRVMIAGNVAGDDVWLQLGNDARARCTLNRRDGHVVLRVPGHDGRVVRWDADRQMLVDGAGANVDLAGEAHAALEALVAAWATHPSFAESADGSAKEFDDEPTKG
jgi:hypothetical protein